MKVATILNELTYNKPMEISKIMSIVDDVVMSNMDLEDAVMEILGQHGIDTLEYDMLERKLYIQDEHTVHKILRKLARLG